MPVFQRNATTGLPCCSSSCFPVRQRSFATGKRVPVSSSRIVRLPHQHGLLCGHLPSDRRVSVVHAISADVQSAPQSHEAQQLRHLKLAAVCIASSAVWALVCAVHPGSASNFASLTIGATTEASKGAYVIAAQSAWAGLAAGFLHTLCGPDHLADRFHDFVPALSKWAGVIVGLTLLAIGIMGVYETVFSKDDNEEAHAPIGVSTTGGNGAAAVAQGSLKAGMAIYATGIVYGLQPDALFVVIPALALPTKLAATAYCVMFVIGTVTAMGGYTALIGTTSAALVKERPWLQSHLSTIASAIAIVVGGLILASGLGVNVPFFG